MWCRWRNWLRKAGVFYRTNSGWRFYRTNSGWRFYRTNSGWRFYRTNSGWAGWLAPTRGQITNLPHIMQLSKTLGRRVGTRLEISI
jgi:hypothetical protein